MRSESNLATRMHALALVAVLALLVVAVGLFLRREPSSGVGRTEATEDEVASSLAEESVELELLYDEAVAEDDVPTEEQTRWLEEALLAQREHARFSGPSAGAALDREAGLERKLARARTLRARERSQELERLAGDQLSVGDREGALGSLPEAIRLQEWINARESMAGLRDEDREEQLRLRLEGIEVQPLADEVDRLEMAAQSAALENRPAEAEGLYLQAAALLERIILEHPRSPHASRLRLEAIENERMSMGATILVRQRDEAVVEAMRRREAGLRADAARLFEHAAGLQRQINALFPASRAASEALVEQFERARLEALDMSPGASVR